MRKPQLRELVSVFAVFIALAMAPSSRAEDKIGVILPLTGDFARYGEKVREGLEREKSSSVRYVYEDEGCNPRVAVSAFQKLHSIDKTKVFLGPWCGSPQIAVASLVAKVGGLAILGASAPERVYQLSSGRMFAVQPSIETESTFNANESYRLGARKVVIVFMENDFSRAHEDAFRKAFQGEVLDTLVYSNSDGSALRAIATRIKRLSPDTVYMPDASPLMHGLIKQLDSVGLRGLRLMSVYSAQSDDVLSVVGSGGEGLIYSYPDIPEEALHHYPRLAARVVADAVQDCPNRDPECMKDAITKKKSIHSMSTGCFRASCVLKPYEVVSLCGIRRTQQ